MAISYETWTRYREEGFELPSKFGSDIWRWNNEPWALFIRFEGETATLVYVNTDTQEELSRSEHRAYYYDDGTRAYSCLGRIISSTPA